ncbi:hypothetical protein ACF07D_09975 [Leucobacter sp. NPDC015123]|uniref:hypothetical protein n=1 Tax=Leucobacter sp. NPDC015123 TaxID=3364129 RepID=UPI0036F4853F
MGSQLRYSLFGLLGVLIGVFITVTMVFFWYPGHRRLRGLLTESPDAPVAHIVGLAEDGNEVLTILGASHSFPKPSHAVVSFGAAANGLHVYRRFSDRIALLPADRIDDIRLERRTLASGPDREVMSFTIRDETDTPHRLSLTMFSPGKLCMIPYSQKYMQRLLAEFRETLGLEGRVS